MAEEILVEVECVRSTAADIDYFEAGKIYTVDMEWAKRRGIWKYFEPLREVPETEAVERVREDERVRDAIHEEHTLENEEPEAKLAEAEKAERAKSTSVPKRSNKPKKTFTGPKSRSSAGR